MFIPESCPRAAAEATAASINRPDPPELREAELTELRLRLRADCACSPQSGVKARLVAFRLLDLRSVLGALRRCSGSLEAEEIDAAPDAPIPLP